MRSWDKLTPCASTATPASDISKNMGIFLETCPSHTGNSHLIYWIDLILLNILNPIYMHRKLVLTALSIFESFMEFLWTAGPDPGA